MSAHGEIDVSGMAGFETGSSGRSIHVPAPRSDREFDPDRSVDSERSDRLVFRNGDRLEGHLETIDKAGDLVWRTEQSATPVAFSLDAETVARIEFAQNSGGTVPDSLAYQVHLVNGDVLPADALYFRDGLISIETAYAGVLSVARRHVARIQVEPTRGLRYVGPDGPDGWTFQRNRGEGWRYRDGGFICVGRGGLARDFDLPSSGSVEFTVAMQGNPEFTLSILGANMQNFGNGGYALRFRQSRVNLFRYSQAHGHRRRPMESLENKGLGKGESARIGVFFDVDRGRIVLVINGEVAKEWHEENGRLGKDGDAVLFQSHGGGVLNLSDIEVRAWDGRYPIQPERAGDKDVIRLANGDAMSGEILDIDGKRTVVKTADAELEVPKEQVLTMDFASRTEEPVSRRGARSVVAALGRTGRVSMELKTMDAEALKGSSHVIGDLEIRAEAVRSLDWVPKGEENEPL